MKVDKTKAKVDHPDLRTYADYSTSTSAAPWREVLFVVLLAEKLTLLLNKADVDKRHSAARVGADEMIRAPGLVQGRDERPSESQSVFLHTPGTCILYS